MLFPFSLDRLIKSGAVCQFRQAICRRLALQQAVGFGKLLLRLFPLANVAHDSREQPQVALTYFADREFQREGRSVLAQSGDLATDADNLFLSRF